MSGKKEKDTQKFFTLVFHDGEEEKTTKVPAKKGKSLKVVVDDIISIHGISMESHSLFLNSSNTPLPMDSDSSAYGGNTLYIKQHEKLDKRVIDIMRSSEKRKNSTDNSNKRFSDVLLNVGKSDSFDSTDGGPDDVFDGPLTDDKFYIEDNWNEVIEENEAMTVKLKVQQQAMWELFTTELGFIKDVEVIIYVFQKCFRMLQKEGFLTDVKESLIFANIEEIYKVNITFWKGLDEIIQNARVTRLPILPSQLLEAFQGFETLFQPYIEFCNADTSNMHFPESEKLKQYFAWCDNHERCKRITIAGFLIKPLQRVTKYSLLLKAISNKTEDEDEKVIIEDIRSRVETFVSEINSAIHLRQEQEKLDNVISRISDYSPFEPINDEVEKIVREYCNMNFKGVVPGLADEEKRFIIKEGSMKTIDKTGKKDVYVFLFSDALVISKLKRNIDKYRITRQPYRLNKVVIRDLKEPGQFLLVYLNEYGVAANAFICQVDIKEEEKWKSAIEKAKASYDTIRTNYGLSGEFWDDDLPNSVSKNKVLKRIDAVRKKNTENSSDTIEQPLIKLENNDSTPIYEWDFTLAMVTLAIFIAANFTISRVIDFWF